MQPSPILFQNAMNFILEGPVVRNMLQHARAEDNIERVIAKGKMTTIIVDNRIDLIFPICRMRRSLSFWKDFDRTHLEAILRKSFRLPSRSGTQLKKFSFRWQ